MKEKTPKQHLRTSKVYRGAGLLTIGASTTGGFFAYQSVINWNNFKNDMTDFVVVNQESVKLNMSVALPFLIGMIVFMFVMRKKNKEFFSDKVSLSLLIAICFTYLIYSIIEVTLFSLIGAFSGAVIDEMLFNPLSKKSAVLAGDEKQIQMEYKKEKQRIVARKRAQTEDIGSV